MTNSNKVIDCFFNNLFENAENLQQQIAIRLMHEAKFNPFKLNELTWDDVDIKKGLIKSINNYRTYWVKMSKELIEDILIHRKTQSSNIFFLEKENLESWIYREVSKFRKNPNLYFLLETHFYKSPGMKIVVEDNFPWVESPLFKIILNKKSLDPEQQKLATDYNENGFIVLRNLIDDEMINQIKIDMDKQFLYQEDYQRATNLWQHSESIKKLACHKEILKVLEFLYERTPIPFQTLNFIKSSLQKTHSDTIHFNSTPNKYMCGVWVALEDITPETGAVFYYPKSHKLPEYDFSHITKQAKSEYASDYKYYESFIEDLVDAQELKEETFWAKKGDVLIWTSNLLHGGSSPTCYTSTRYSQVTHYFFEDCAYHSPLKNDFLNKKLLSLDNLLNIQTGQKLKHSFNGHYINWKDPK